MNLIGNYLGIDPGKAGGFAIISGQPYDGIVQTFEMPDTEMDIKRLFEQRIYPARIAFCCIEWVHGIHGAASGSMFTFGRGVGVLIGLLMAYGIPFEECRPQEWQKMLQITPRKKKNKSGPGETTRQWKNRLKGHAQKLFPDVEVSLETADALLLAEVARRTRHDG